MLARENRLQKAEHFRSTMKQGRKVNSDHLVIYLKRDEALAFSRFGFVVAKTVGGAVKRNLVKRRLRAIAREVLVSVDQGEATSSVSNNSNFDVVVRALPGSAELEWNKLREEMLASINKQLGKGA
jgi:ribonuclease P protein component